MTFPDHLTIQWHVNDVCNLRCRHCYQNAYTDKGFPKEKLFTFLDKIEKFIEFLSEKNANLKAHINFTGGEPFLHPDFLDLLGEVRRRQKMSFGILSNGYLLSEQKLKILQAAKPNFIQISIEGDRKMHDEIRGKGAFDAAVYALKMYRKLRIPTIVSFTANAENYNKFSSAVRTARQFGAYKIWTDRYLPDSSDDNLALKSRQVVDFFKIIRREQNKNRYHIFSKLKISGDRALQFLYCEGNPYRCSAGYSLFTVMPSGDIFPCRRLPIRIGNIETDDFETLFLKPPVTIKLPAACSGCLFLQACFGGLRCLTYAVKGDFNGKDIHCSFIKT